MQDKLLDLIREYSFRIDNGRTLSSILDHGRGEMDELGAEIVYHEAGEVPGVDGVPGEAIDAILCLIDLIFQFDPAITNEQILAIAARKLEKWERIYGNKEKENE